MQARPALNALRALALIVPLFVYTFLGQTRNLPPFAAYIQGAVLVALCAWWGWKVIRREGLPRSPLALPFVALMGVAALSALLSVDPRLSLAGLLQVVALVLFFFAVCDLLAAGWAPSIFVNSILVLSTLAIVQGLWGTATWYSAWWQMRVPQYPLFLLPLRLFGVADHPNLLAALINLALPFAIIRLAQSQTAAPRLAYALWLAGADVVLFYTRSRGGWVAAGAVVVLAVGWLLFQAKPPRWRDVTGWLRRSSPVWLVAAAYLALFAALLAFDARSSQSEYSTNGGSITSTAGRSLFWAVAWHDFRAHPLTGSGPLTYGYAYMGSVDGTRAWLSPHAHNLVLNVLAETGVVGLLASAWVGAAALLVLARGWRSAPEMKDTPWAERRSILLCVCAGLLGCLAHSQVDIPFWLPTNTLLAAMLLALGLQAAGALKPGRTGLSRWRALFLSVPVILVYFLVRQNLAQAALMQGVDAATRGDWRVAALSLDQAVSADPTFSFYQAQRGYAYGVVADPLRSGGDSTALGPALTSYEAALHSGPEHVPNLLNAAWLLEQAGSAEEADRVLAAAVRHGADWALPALLLGGRYAAQGRAAEAEALFRTAFSRESQAREMAACRQSPACRTAAERYPATPSAVGEAHDRAQALLAQGRPAEALIALQNVPVTSGAALPWLDRADAYIMLGQQAQARYSLAVVDTLGADGPAYEDHSARSRAAYFRSQGQMDEAIAALERIALPQTGDLPYSLWILGRIGLPGPLLPSVAMLQRTSEGLAVYRELAQLYAEQGRLDDAAWAQEQAAALAGLLGEAGSAP